MELFGFDGFDDSERVMINLEILGNIKGSEKISLKGPYLSLEYHTPIITPLKRRIKGDNRKEIMTKIMNLVNKTNDVLKSEKTTEKMRNDIIIEIPKAINGLKKMQETYEGDAVTISQLDVICKKLKSMAEENE